MCRPRDMEARTFRMKRWLVVACVVGAVALFGGRPGSAVEFHCNACDVKASEVERCQRMDPADYVTGLLFNPPGMKTYFKRSEEHTSELPSLMRISYAVFCLNTPTPPHNTQLIHHSPTPSYKQQVTI